MDRYQEHDAEPEHEPAFDEAYEIYDIFRGGKDKFVKKAKVDDDDVKPDPYDPYNVIKDEKNG